MSVQMHYPNSKKYIEVPLYAGYFKAIPNSIAQMDWFLANDLDEKQNLNSFAGSIDKTPTILENKIENNKRFRVKNQRFLLF